MQRKSAYREAGKKFFSWYFGKASVKIEYIYEKEFLQYKTSEKTVRLLILGKMLYFSYVCGQIPY